MLNKEKFAKEIVEVALRGGLALRDGVPVVCKAGICTKCDWNGSWDCYKRKVDWANSEYFEEPTDPNWEIDTKILVSNDGETWYPVYYAGFEPVNHRYRAWAYGATSWTAPAVGLRRLSWKYAKLP